MKRITQTALLVLSGTGLLPAQVPSVDKLEAKYLNGYKIMGTGVTRTYKELLADRPTKKIVVVAVIEIPKSGGIVNAYEAMKLADKTSGTK